MNTRGARTALIVVGAIAALIGAVFAGQGAGLIPGSSMTGDPTWLYIGIVMVVVGVVLIVVGVRRRGA
jgi:energy-converting hydrogenase Eha subunit E